jgi:hypothetical protein
MYTKSIRSLVVISVVLLVAMVLVGCGGDDEEIGLWVKII